MGGGAPRVGTPPAPAFTLKPPGRLHLRWGWGGVGESHCAVSLGVGDNVGGPRGPACGSLLTAASRPWPACDHGQQGSSGHCAPLPAPRPRRNSLKRDVGARRAQVGASCPAPVGARECCSGTFRDLESPAHRPRSSGHAASWVHAHLPRESSGSRPRVTLVILLR